VRRGDVGRSHNARRAPKEEEAGLLHPEVSNRSPRRHVFEGREFDFLVFVFTGWRLPCPPRARQGVEVGRGRPHEEAFIEGAASGRERGDGDGRGSAQRDCSSGATIGGGGSDGGHDHGGHHAVGSADAGSSRRQSGGSGGDPRRGCPAARLGPVGEPACASPRAPGGGACGEG
jgi:hypothetical protein